MPLLHETLVHPSLPRIELHWRVHWYERRFAADALARATKPAADAPLEMQPLDGLIALMLFYARDGFAGLRFPADAAAWWDVKCAGSAGPAPGELVAERYPRLVAPVSVASTSAGRPRRYSARGSPCGLPFRWRVAAGLASPFLEGGRLQAEANAGLIDLLLAPPSAAGDALRRVMRNAPATASTAAQRTGLATGERVSHVLRVARRWALAVVPAIVRGYDAGPADVTASCAQRAGVEPQRGQPGVPLPADLGDPCHGLRQRLRRHPVAHVAPLALALEQAGLGERVEVLDHRLARDRQLVGELGRRRRMGGDRREQAASCRVREGAEHCARCVGGHRQAATSAGP